MRSKWLCGLLLLGALWSAAEEVSPWTRWRQGHELTRKGESARERGDYRQAIKLYSEAAETYRALKKQRPDWNQEVIDKRLEVCESELAKARRALGEVEVEELPPLPPPRSTGSAEAVAGTSSDRDRWLAAQVELAELRKQLTSLQLSAAAAETLLRENREWSRKYQLLEARFRELEQRAADPKGEVQELRNKLAEIQLEREAMATRLEVAGDRSTRQEKELAELRLRLAAVEATDQAAARERAEREKELTALREFRQNATNEKNQDLVRIRDLTRQLEQAGAQDARRKQELEQLSTRLQEALKSGGDMGKVNADLAREGRELRQQLEELQKRYTAAIQDRQTLQESVRALQLELTDVKGTLLRNDDLRTQAEQAARRQAAELLQQREAARAQEKRAGELEEKCRALEAELKTWSGRYATLREQLKSEQTVSSGALARADALRQGLEDENARLKTELTAGREQLKRSTEDASGLQVELAKLKQQLAQQQAGREQLEQSAAELAQMKRELEQRNRVLEKTRGELAAARALEPKLEEAERQVKELAGVRRELEESARKNQELTRENARLTLALQQQQKKSSPAAAPASEPAKPVTPIAPESENAASLAELRRAGQEAEQRGDLEVAIWNFRTLLERNPADFEANARLGAIWLGREEFERALEPLERARLVHPESLPVLFDYVAALLGVGRGAEAVTLLESVKEIQSEPVPALLWGRALAATADGRAAAALRRAAELAPQSAAANLELARCLVGAGEEQRPEAARFYARAKQLGATPVPALEQQLGDQLHEQSELIDFLRSTANEAEKSGDADAVVWYLQQLVELEPENPVSLLRLNGYQFRQGQYEAAAVLWRARPEAPEGELVAALAALAGKRPDEAVRLWDSAVRRHGNQEFKLPAEAAVLKQEAGKLLGSAPEALKKRLEAL